MVFIVQRNKGLLWGSMKIKLLIAVCVIIIISSIFNWYEEREEAMGEGFFENEQMIINKISHRNICLEPYHRHLCDLKMAVYTRYY